MARPERIKARDARDMADERMTEALRGAYPERMRTHPHNPDICIACTCGSGRCFKVIKLKSVMKNKSATLKCPAHNREAATFSALAKTFAAVIHDAVYDAAVVWDWHCVPGNPNMSIDACVWHGQRCTHFELDGSVHFMNGLHERSHDDERKDAIMNMHCMGMLRLHYKDMGLWPVYVTMFMQHAKARVHYTASYRCCLRGEQSEADILELCNTGI